ncbi:MAG: Uma2 family endonuclease [Merismopedia sp. SIO2A8]|nr:Uma2 family endonuclease [Merismopedia sp. SIO2A8]
MTRTLYKWTVDDYHRAIDAGLFEQQVVELLQGDIVVMPPEREPHACYSSVGADSLRQTLGILAAIRETKPVTLPNNSEPLPDIAIVTPPLKRYIHHHPYPEDIFWIIEYSNATLKKDLSEKKAVYAEAGIPEYWVVDLKNQQLYVFRNLVQGTYQSQQILTNQTIAPLSFPNVNIDVQQLFN